jgi:hypothetical protein
VLTMATDEFTNYYTDLLDSSYDCVLDNAHLMRMAGRFSRRG